MSTAPVGDEVPDAAGNDFMVSPDTVMRPLTHYYLKLQDMNADGFPDPPPAGDMFQAPRTLPSAHCLYLRLWSRQVDEQLRHDEGPEDNFLFPAQSPMGSGSERLSIGELLS